MAKEKTAMSEKKGAGKTFLLSAIRKAIDPNKEALLVVEDFVIIYSIDREAQELKKTKMLFKKAGHRYVQIDLEKTVTMIAEKLAPHFDPKRFLKELIMMHSDPEEIMELKERLEGKAAKITAAPLCYSLMIGGKPGKPYEFNLVG